MTEQIIYQTVEEVIYQAASYIPGGRRDEPGGKIIYQAVIILRTKKFIYQALNLVHQIWLDVHIPGELVHI
jgi:hypothetical protein